MNGRNLPHLLIFIFVSPDVDGVEEAGQAGLPTDDGHPALGEIISSRIPAVTRSCCL